MSGKCRLLDKCRRSDSSRAADDLGRTVNDLRRTPKDEVLRERKESDLLWTRESARSMVAKVKSNSFSSIDRQKPIFRQGDGIR